MTFMEHIRTFMLNIVIFSVVSAFCTHLLPEKKYQKFARFTVGLLYIHMLLALLSQFLGNGAAGILF